MMLRNKCTHCIEGVKELSLALVLLRESIQLRSQNPLGLPLSWICAFFSERSSWYNTQSLLCIGRAALTRIREVSPSIAQAAISQLRRLRLFSAFSCLFFIKHFQSNILHPQVANLGNGFL